MDNQRINKFNTMGAAILPQIKELLSSGEPTKSRETLFGFPVVLDDTMPKNQIKLVETPTGKIVFMMNID